MTVVYSFIVTQFRGFVKVINGLKQRIGIIVEGIKIQSLKTATKHLKLCPIALLLSDKSVGGNLFVQFSDEWTRKLKKYGR